MVTAWGPAGSDRARVSLLPAAGVRLEPGAVEYCLELDHRVTTCGFDLLDRGLVQDRRVP